MGGLYLGELIFGDLRYKYCTVVEGYKFGVRCDPPPDAPPPHPTKKQKKLELWHTTACN